MTVITPRQLRDTSVGVAVECISCAIKHICEQISGSKRAVDPRANRENDRPVSIVLQTVNFGFSKSRRRSLSLQPDDLLTIPWMALSIDSMRFVSSAHAILATGF